VEQMGFNSQKQAFMPIPWSRCLIAHEPMYTRTIALISALIMSGPHELAFWPSGEADVRRVNPGAHRGFDAVLKPEFK